MVTPRFRLESEGGITRLTLDYPQRANAVDRATIEALRVALDDLARDSGLRGLVLTGAGERVFCGGADLNELAGQTATSAHAHDYDAAWDAVTGRLARLPCLSVARLNGACVGGGVSLAIACDLRIAAQGAFFQYPALKNRSMPSPDDVERMLRLIGPARAKRLWLGGGRVTATEAREWGLVEQVVAPAELDEAVTAALATASAADPAIARATKRLIDGGYRDPAEVERIYRAAYDRDAGALDGL